MGSPVGSLLSLYSIYRGELRFESMLFQTHRVLYLFIEASIVSSYSSPDLQHLLFLYSRPGLPDTFGFYIGCV